KATFANAQRRAMGELATGSQEVRIVQEGNEPGMEAEVATTGIGSPEQRRERRRPCQGHICLLPYDGITVGQAMKVECFDISTSGIGLLLAEPPRIGSQFVVILRSATTMGTLILYTIRHARCV